MLEKLKAGVQTKNLYKNVDSGTVHSSQNVEIT